MSSILTLVAVAEVDHCRVSSPTSSILAWCNHPSVLDTVINDLCPLAAILHLRYLYQQLHAQCFFVMWDLCSFKKQSGQLLSCGVLWRVFIPPPLECCISNLQKEVNDWVKKCMEYEMEGASLRENLVRECGQRLSGM